MFSLEFILQENRNYDFSLINGPFVLVSSAKEQGSPKLQIQR